MFKTIDGIDVRGKRVLLRVDLNVPVRDGRITDLSRIERVSPTISELARSGAKVIVVSHFDRPRGQRVESMSLRPVSAAMRDVLGLDVFFADDCLGPVAEDAVARLEPGQVLMLENTRFHPGEEENDPEMARRLAALADIYVNDAFSSAHRAHASTEGVTRHLPSHAGRLMQREIEALSAALDHPDRPVCAIVGGAKVSTKLALIGNLLGRVDVLVIGGAMANTFLAAQGVGVGRSLQEPDMHDTARGILDQARQGGCDIVHGYGVPRTRPHTRRAHRAGTAGRDDPGRGAGNGRGRHRKAARDAHARLERPARRVRDPALRCGHRVAGARRGCRDQGRPPPLGRRRRRHGGGAEACRGQPRDELHLHRRRRLS